MLDKIVNIKSNFPYKSDHHSGGGFEKLLQGSAMSKFNIQDSIKFSPAAYFLSRINWQLKDITFSGKEKVTIDFYIGDFEFHTEIDFQRFNSEPRQFYDIKKEVDAPDYRSKILVGISAVKTNKEFPDEMEIMEFNGLSKLFDRIYNLTRMNLNSEIEITKDLTDGIRYNLFDEFDYINTTLYVLIEKLENRKLSGEFPPVEEESGQIIIEKITTVNDKQLS